MRAQNDDSRQGVSVGGFEESLASETKHKEEKSVDIVEVQFIPVFYITHLCIYLYSH